MNEHPLPKQGMLGASIGYAAVWLLLMLLLGANLWTAYFSFGSFAPALHLGIAVAQALLMWWLFMNLRASSAPVRLCAASGLLWLIFMFSLIFSDYLTRDWNGALTPFSERAANMNAK